VVHLSVRAVPVSEEEQAVRIGRAPLENP